MSLLKMILPDRSAKFLTFFHLLGVILIFSQVSIGRSKDSVYSDNSTKNQFDYITDVIRRYQRQYLNSGLNCQLPSNPAYGRYAILGDSVTSYRPGDFANEFRSLEIHCNRGYAVSPFERNITICINGTWNPQPTACLRTCPSLISTETTTVKCRLNNIPLANCVNPVMGTRAILSCTPFYEDRNIQRSPVHVCRTNGWYPSTSTCYPTCGNKNPKGNPNIIGGQNVTIGDYPWQIGIYNSTTKAFICGGSLIEQNIILTAAHCVTDYQGAVRPAEQYSVAVGKYFSRYDEPRDLFAQYSNVLTIHVPDRYTGRINAFALDIAVLILEIYFTLSEGVQPICIALSDDPSDLNFLSASDNGVVTGWGYTIEDGDISDVLKELTIPLIPFHKCSSELPERFRRYFTYDKLCGGYLNNRTSICSGDSGGALAFKNLVDNRYYVRGIVSTSPASEEALTCDPNQYSLYTSVDQHINFVRDLVVDNQFRTPIECLDDNCQNNGHQIEHHQETISKNCEIPNYGSHVIYTIMGSLEKWGNINKIPGDDVKEFSLLETTCDDGYKPNVSSDLHTICVSGKWNPSLTLRCLRTCPSLNSTLSTSVICKYNEILVKDCCNPIEGTRASLFCNEFYELDALQINTIRTCTAGRWTPEISRCHPMCGVKRPKGRPNIINTQNASMGDYPWQVGIYDRQKSFLCGGSILDRHIILTAAQCVTNYSGQVLPLQNYHVAAGKYYREYYDDRDEFAQYSKILQVHLTERYKGIETFFAEDIAVIILADPFTISEVVQPVCIQLNKKSQYLYLASNSSGIITGWGKTLEASELSEVLKELVVPIVPFHKCHEELPRFFQGYLTSDKICAGYLNNGTAICSGDTGGALVFKNISSERYYVEGIASTYPPTKYFMCDSNQYALYTSVKEHIDFIKNLLKRYQIPQLMEFVPAKATSEDNNKK